jgi:branched-chain amino acid transport system substrate-binding protein
MFTVMNIKFPMRTHSLASNERRTKMNRFSKVILLLSLVFLSVMILSPAQSLAAAPKVNAKFDFDKMSDMSDFDPNKPVVPTGDTYKIGALVPMSGAQAIPLYWLVVQWVAHDYNKRGGIMIDGKRKLIEVIPADMEWKPDVTKKVAERLILENKVNALWGTPGSANQKVVNEVANKYKVITQNALALTDDLYEGANFTRYSFMTCWSSGQIGRGMAYYYGQIRKKEKKFYILCQDNLFGHVFGEGFKNGLKEYFPDAQVVGEEYHKMFLADFAPYISKIKASGAEVIYTGDFIPDSAIMIKQARQLGVNIPVAHIYADDPAALTEIGVEGTKNLVQVTQYGSDGAFFKNPYLKFFNNYINSQKKWKAPFDTIMYKYPLAAYGSYIEQTYWFFSVLERAASADPEKIIKVWEGDTYQIANGKILQMRVCDHKTIQDLHVYEYGTPAEQEALWNIPPYYFDKNFSSAARGFKIPADKITPRIDPTMDRCKGVK